MVPYLARLLLIGGACAILPLHALDAAAAETETGPDRALTIVLPDTPPFAIRQDGGIKGLGVDILHAIAGKAGIRFRPQIATIPRIRELILKQDTDLALFIPMRWTEGIMRAGQPIFCFSITLYSLKKNPVRNLQDLKGRDLASLPGGMFSSRLREKTGVNFIAAKGDAVMARLLISERVDAVVMGSHFARLLFDAERRRQNKLDAQLAPPLHLWTQPYVILSNPHKVPPVTEQAINQAIIALHDQNIIAALLKKHGAEQHPCPEKSVSNGG